ncbi:MULTISPECIES: helix-turn-helix domain-containing protein [unclassified Caballeronia]|uniref:helix-turn-helix domain-containing protein n=1 Tax=unclassified Caballeronia TaxID=2646786 RepID=UPI0028552045|nr:MULTISPECIES: helix-turn-helix domain-containing protein [unclassified Caballeronia]MDR5750362.1 helix-turn-helix domain-containing protein [Caballeronia sp. LZ024]MDR5842606.1 helix-turn-helix domain-containing protein [Caballeronia sp. LZ031]
MADFTESEAAAILHISEANVLRLIAAGDLRLDRHSVLAYMEKLRRARPPQPRDDEHSYRVEGLLQTNVTVCLGDGTGDTVHIVCDGTMLSFGESRWRSARSALNGPDPRGPFPVANVFSVFVHEVRLEGPVEWQVRASLRVDVECRDGLAYASVHSTEHRIDLAPVEFVIGDDVVTIARAILEAAGCAG